MERYSFVKDNPTQAVLNRIIDNLLSEYNFLNHSVIGKSLCGRDIRSLQLGNPDRMVFLNGAHHGTEWITALLLLKFVNKMCEHIKLNKKFCGIDISACLKKAGVMIVPCVNSDGVEISLIGSSAACEYSELVKKIDNTSAWKANARGVDLNHNYNAGWYELHRLEQESGITGPSYTRYGGIAPESESETQAVTRLCRENYFTHALAFHSQGEEIYWHYGENTPENSEVMAKIFAISSGYEMSRPEGLAIGGGFKDWFIKEFHRPAFTIEIGLGQNPLPFSDLNKVYKKLEKMLFISILM